MYTGQLLPRSDGRVPPYEVGAKCNFHSSFHSLLDARVISRIGLCHDTDHSILCTRSAAVGHVIFSCAPSGMLEDKNGEGNLLKCWNLMYCSSCLMLDSVVASNSYLIKNKNPDMYQSESFLL